MKEMVKTHMLIVLQEIISYCITDKSLEKQQQQPKPKEMSYQLGGLNTRKPVLGVCEQQRCNQPEHSRSLISALFIHLLKSITPRLVARENSII